MSSSVVIRLASICEQIERIENELCALDPALRGSLGSWLLSPQRDLLSARQGVEALKKNIVAVSDTLEAEDAQEA